MSLSTGEKLTAIGIFLTVLGLLWGVTAFIKNRNEQRRLQAEQQAIQQQQRAEDQAQHQFDATPRIHMESARYQNGDTVVTLQNDSPVTRIAISRAEYEIDDPDQLRIIQRRHPRPRPEDGIGEKNDQDVIVFKNGSWGNNSYLFATDVGLNIAPGKPNDLVLPLINPRWHGQQFRGRLTIYFNDGRTYSPDALITITGRAR